MVYVPGQLKLLFLQQLSRMQLHVLLHVQLAWRCSSMSLSWISSLDIRLNSRLRRPAHCARGSPFWFHTCTICTGVGT
jgi:hypothetical protein